MRSKRQPAVAWGRAFALAGVLALGATACDDDDDEGARDAAADARPGDAGPQVDGPADDAASADLADDAAPSPAAVGLELVVDGLTAPVVLKPAADGSGRLFVAEQDGVIRIIDAQGTLVAQPYLDLQDRLVELNTGYDERGLLGFTPHPDFATNGRVFIYYSAPLRDGAPQDYDHTSVLAELTVSAADPDQADPGSERILLQVDQPQGNHNAGQIAFGPDGYLYVALGDGGGANDTGLGHVADWYAVNDGGNGQDIDDNLLGSILRLDVDGEAPYAIPQDNPFVGDAAGRDEIWAYGFRNPFRFSFDRGGDRALFVGDVGQNRWEEVSVAVAGGNYGWNVKEATHCFNAEAPSEPLAQCPDSQPGAGPLIDPIIEYPNANQGDGIGLAVIGGFVYRGTALAGLAGRYVFADWSRSFQEGDGTLLVATPPAGGSGLWELQELAIAGRQDGRLGEYILSLGEGQDGELFLLTSEAGGPTGDSGKVYRVVPAGS